MPTTRRRIPRAMTAGITPEAIEAWRAGDYWALWSALRLDIWQMPDWAEDPPGTDARPEHMRRLWPAPDVAALKIALIELAGPLPRRWRYRMD